MGDSVSDPYSSNPDPAKNLNQDPGRQALNPDPDPDPSYFFTLPVSEKKLKLCYYNKFLSSKEVNVVKVTKKLNYVTFLTFS